MACLICGATAIELLSAGHFVEMDCPECGYYGIPKELVDEISIREQKLHVERTRAYLAMRAENKQSPWITPVDINIHQLFVITPV
ncbi:hypothetical protein BLL42_21275 [Pseudomonas frederiksbergensis]|uniref:Transcription factor zinc-finger domain-containing protein n=2 Tax=Pseudomonas frederiksbergensis TaxID=104087 RepID=A0A1J0EPR5_9PSED|nr:hypothetical protein BLL42_21275 [Pseudomonas frederiksbergensis]